MYGLIVKSPIFNCSYYCCYYYVPPYIFFKPIFQIVKFVYNHLHVVYIIHICIKLMNESFV